MQASDVFTRVSRVLQDEAKVRWAEPELAEWLTDALRVLVLVRPDAAMANTTMDLVEGSRQTLPADGLRLLDARCASWTARCWIPPTPTGIPVAERL